MSWSASGCCRRRGNTKGDQQCRALRSPANRARVTAAHSSGSDEQIFGADEQVPGRGQRD
jgi:hypothetical protein